MGKSKKSKKKAKVDQPAPLPKQQCPPKSTKNPPKHHKRPHTYSSYQHKESHDGRSEFSNFSICSGATNTGSSRGASIGPLLPHSRSVSWNRAPTHSSNTFSSYRFNGRGYTGSFTGDHRQWSTPRFRHYRPVTGYRGSTGYTGFPRAPGGHTSAVGGMIARGAEPLPTRATAPARSGANAEAEQKQRAMNDKARLIKNLLKKAKQSGVAPVGCSTSATQSVSSETLLIGDHLPTAAPIVGDNTASLGSDLQFSSRDWQQIGSGSLVAEGRSSPVEDGEIEEVRVPTPPPRELIEVQDSSDSDVSGDERTADDKTCGTAESTGTLLDSSVSTSRERGFNESSAKDSTHCSSQSTVGRAPLSTSSSTLVSTHPSPLSHSHTVRSSLPNIHSSVNETSICVSTPHTPTAPSEISSTVPIYVSDSTVSPAQSGNSTSPVSVAVCVGDVDITSATTYNQIQSSCNVATTDTSRQRPETSQLSRSEVMSSSLDVIERPIKDNAVSGITRSSPFCTVTTKASSLQPPAPSSSSASSSCSVVSRVEPADSTEARPRPVSSDKQPTHSISIKSEPGRQQTAISTAAETTNDKTAAVKSTVSQSVLATVRPHPLKRGAVPNLGRFLLPRCDGSLATGSGDSESGGVYYRAAKRSRMLPNTLSDTEKCHSPLPTATETGSNQLITPEVNVSCTGSVTAVIPEVTTNQSGSSQLVTSEVNASHTASVSASLPEVTMGQTGSNCSQLAVIPGGMGQLTTSDVHMSDSAGLPRQSDTLQQPLSNSAITLGSGVGSNETGSPGQFSGLYTQQFSVLGNSDLSSSVNSPRPFTTQSTGITTRVHSDKSDKGVSGIEIGVGGATGVEGKVGGSTGCEDRVGGSTGLADVGGATGVRDGGHCATGVGGVDYESGGGVLGGGLSEWRQCRSLSDVVLVFRHQLNTIDEDVSRVKSQSAACSSWCEQLYLSRVECQLLDYHFMVERCIDSLRTEAVRLRDMASQLSCQRMLSLHTLASDQSPWRSQIVAERSLADRLSGLVGNQTIEASTVTSSTCHSASVSNAAWLCNNADMFSGAQQQMGNMDDSTESTANHINDSPSQLSTGDNTVLAVNSSSVIGSDSQHQVALPSAPSDSRLPVLRVLDQCELNAIAGRLAYLGQLEDVTSSLLVQCPSAASTLRTAAVTAVAASSSTSSEAVGCDPAALEPAVMMTCPSDDPHTLSTAVTDYDADGNDYGNDPGGVEDQEGAGLVVSDCVSLAGSECERRDTDGFIAMFRSRPPQPTKGTSATSGETPAAHASSKSSVSPLDGGHIVLANVKETISSIATCGNLLVVLTESLILRVFRVDKPRKFRIAEMYQVDMASTVQASHTSQETPVQFDSLSLATTKFHQQVWAIVGLSAPVGSGVSPAAPLSRLVCANVTPFRVGRNGGERGRHFCVSLADLRTCGVADTAVQELSLPTNCTAKKSDQYVYDALIRCISHSQEVLYLAGSKFLAAIPPLVLINWLLASNSVTTPPPWAAPSLSCYVSELTYSVNSLVELSSPTGTLLSLLSELNVLHFCRPANGVELFRIPLYSQCQLLVPITSNTGVMAVDSLSENNNHLYVVTCQADEFVLKQARIASARFLAVCSVDKQQQQQSQQQQSNTSKLAYAVLSDNSVVSVLRSDCIDGSAGSFCNITVSKVAGVREEQDGSVMEKDDARSVLLVWDKHLVIGSRSGKLEVVDIATRVPISAFCSGH